MTLYGINPKHQEPTLINKSLDLSTLGWWFLLLFPVQLTWVVLYHIFDRSRGWHRHHRVTFEKEGIRHVYKRVETVYPYATMELVTAAYNTKGYVRQSDHKDFSFLQFAIADDEFRVYHDHPVAKHEKMLKRLAKNGVRLQETRNGGPARFGRAV